MPSKVTAKRIINKGPDLKLGYGYLIPENSESIISLEIYKNFAFTLDRSKKIQVINHTGNIKEEFQLVNQFKKVKKEEPKLEVIKDKEEVVVERKPEKKVPTKKKKNSDKNY